jgi:folate-dependent phosphoribosylglycinamide formyltransferase PurN
VGGAYRLLGFLDESQVREEDRDRKGILLCEAVDILLLATDAIIRSPVLRIPRLATLNAHPGWVPQFRGLGSNYFEMQEGYLPAVSVHQVDEGVDTGPLIVRRHVAVEPGEGLDAVDRRVERVQCELFVEVIRRLEAGTVRYVDTFLEPSNMTQGMSLRRRARLDAALRAGEVRLRPLGEEA